MIVTPEILLAFAGILLSLAFSYIPGLLTWYELKAKEEKQLIMLAFIALAASLIFGGACLGLLIKFGLVLACTAEGGFEIVRAFFVAVVFNQGTYQSNKYIATRWHKRLVMRPEKGKHKLG